MVLAAAASRMGAALANAEDEGAAVFGVGISAV